MTTTATATRIDQQARSRFESILKAKNVSELHALRAQARRTSDVTLETFEAGIEKGVLAALSVVKPVRETDTIVGVATVLVHPNGSDILCIGGGMTIAAHENSFLSAAATSLYRQPGKLQGVVIGVIAGGDGIDLFGFEKEFEL
jgi:hypothetical protein